MHGQQNGRVAGISIIVPCWREDAVSEAQATQWLADGNVKEVLVASPESGVGAGSASIRWIACPRTGRGIQMNEAARQAAGDILLFHHADTELTGEHLVNLSLAMADERIGGGAFRRRFDERHPHLRWLEPLEALRCRLFGPLFGDQSIFVRRRVFEAMGGFAETPLMEDVEFTVRLRAFTRIVLLAPAISSSPRKHLQQGRWRSTLLNAVFLLLYLFGASPARLHAWYYRGRKSPVGR